ncbi:MAG: PfkB family carbohydrate kinase [bacterium]
MKITILGHVCIDKNTSEHATYVTAGSPAIFMSKILKQLPENQVKILAPYGSDFLQYYSGQEIYPEVPVNKQTLIYENITKNSKREQKAWNRELALPITIDQNCRNFLTTTDLIFITPLLPNFSATYLSQTLANLPKQSLKVLLPQGYYRDFDQNVITRDFQEAADILPLMDLVIVSEQDHPQMLETARQWVNEFKIIVVITLGEKGALILTQSEELLIPAQVVPENEIVDSVGSGDIFSVGFAFRYLQTKSLREAGRFANALARQCLFYTPDQIKIDYKALVKDKLK